jgi:A/G-specific adenine glycosylase
MNDNEQQQINNSDLHQVVSPLLAWYDDHARILPWREDPEPYAVWISEIMLQQTRVEAVKPYFDRWMKAFPDLASLAAASESEVLKLWEGLGYYSRARNLRNTAMLVMEQYDGRLPASFEELRKLPGIGEYTAGSVGSIAFGLPVPCVDGNVLRVVTRWTAEAIDISTAAAKKLITGWVKAIIPVDRPGDFNQAMMELGATVCLPNGQPKCDICPAAFLCEAYRADRISEFPVKSGKAPRKQEKKTVLVIINQTRAALRKRPDSGLLAGLWEFPNFDGELSEPDILRVLGNSGLEATVLVKLKNAKHIFTHIEWDMTGYLARVDIDSEDLFRAEGLEWMDLDRIDQHLALPSAFKTYQQAMKQYLSS